MALVVLLLKLKDARLPFEIRRRQRLVSATAFRRIVDLR